MLRPVLRLTLALVATLAVALSAAGAATAKPLKEGSRGARVVKLQRALHIAPADGVFGPGTERAVKRWQRRHHLTADGVVGAGTWRMVRRARAARSAGHRRGITVRTRGADVRLLQRHLGIGADGVFGPGTARAVRAFQRSRGLTVDGVVGPGTWAALGVAGSHPVLRRTRRGASARSSVLARAVRAANRIARLPYRYGGGHASFRDTGYDCSGSVSYVLHAIGMLSAPLDSGALMSYGAPGRGRRITVYASPSHAYMVIGGRRFDTTGRAEDGTRWDSRRRSATGYVVRHPPGL
jgi:cell wall-associated NlpC family hydrolase